MPYSHSRVETYKQCPRKYKYQYILKYPRKENYDANNPLWLGTALHEGIQVGKQEGIEEYKSHYPLLDTNNWNEIIKLEMVIDKCVELLPKSDEILIELEIKNDNFIGYIDYLVKVADGVYDLYDFKYSNNIDNYLESDQLHLYKYYLETQHPNIKIRDTYFLFAPKTFIRQKKSENIFQFRKRLKDTLNSMDAKLVKVDFDINKVKEFEETCHKIENATDFPKCESKLCQWCDYQEECKKEDNGMALPKNERREIKNDGKLKMWIYGEPRSGKSTFCNGFENVLFLNTDGNIYNIDAPYVAIKNTKEGRKEVTAWENFKSTLEELKEDTEFETVVVDVLDHVYESCRNYVCKLHGIEHESDEGFGKGYDKIKREFYDTMREFNSLDKNIIYISHTTTKEVTERNKTVTVTKPNINDKIATQISGMVDIVAMCEKIDGEYRLVFPQDGLKFGGGRTQIDLPSCPLNVKDFMEVYKEGKSRGIVKQERVSANLESEIKTAPAPLPEKEEVKEEPNEEVKEDVEEPKEMMGTQTVATRRRKAR